MHEGWGPRQVAGRGVYEDVCWAMDDPTGFYLRAIDTKGFCIGRVTVHDADEYELGLARLTALLNERDPVIPCASSAGGGIRLLR